MSDFIFPDKFEQRMRSALGPEWDRFRDAHQEVPPTSVRLNPLKESVMRFSGSVPWSLFGKYLPERPWFTLDPLLHAGAYYVQEASSMFLEQALRQTVDLSKPLRVLDLSAAPGGKSTHILSLISSDSLLVSNEVIRNRASTLVENIQKWGYANCLVTSNDPSDFSTLTGFFDAIVVDAPCSGEGLFRKDANSMREWSEDNVALCAARQKRILNDVWPALKENGILIYSTCTYNERENENNLLEFSKQHAVSFETLDTDPSWNVSKVEHHHVTGYRFFPHKLSGEGFFLSVIRKNQADAGSTIRAKNKLTLAPAAIVSRVKHWLKTNNNAFIMHQDLLFFLPQNLVAPVDHLLQQLKFVYAGTNLATLKRDKLVPEHALALSTQLSASTFDSIDVELQTAICYLRRDTISLNGNKGFNLITYQNLPVGWINLLENRVNNMYPQDWRIRMLQPKK